MGFLQICAGVVLLQMSKSAKDVPDAAVFKGDLDQVREIAEVEQPESEPKADAIRGTAALIRRLSVSRQKMEQEEARRLREDRMKDQLEPLRENEIVEWDGLRRRKTVIGEPGSSPVLRRKTVHPPLGMSHFPDPNEEENEPGPGLFENLRNRAQSVIRQSTPQHANTVPADSLRSPLHPVALTDITVHPSKAESPIVPYGPGSLEDAQERIYGLPPGKRKEQDMTAGVAGAQPSPRSKPLPTNSSPSQSLKPPQEARRQFSFTNLLRPSSRTPDIEHAVSRPALQSRARRASHEQKRARKNATEEERLGLVKGDSHLALLQHESPRSPERPQQAPTHSHPVSHSQSSSIASADDYYRYQYPSPPQRSLSYSDEDDGWQMTNSASPPNEKTSNPLNSIPLPLTTSSQRRPSPPRTYQPPPLVTRNTPPNTAEQRPIPVPGTMVGGGPTQGRAKPAASGHSQSSSTSQNQNPNRSHGIGLHQGSGGRHQAQVSEGTRGSDEEVDASTYAIHWTEGPEEYEASRKRFEEQSKREREERRLRAMGRRQSGKPTASEGGSFV